MNEEPLKTLKAEQNSARFVFWTINLTAKWLNGWKREPLEAQARDPDNAGGWRGQDGGCWFGDGGSKPLQMTFRFLIGDLGDGDRREAWGVEGTDEEVCFDTEFGMPTRESHGDTSEKLPGFTWPCFYQAKGCLFIYSHNILSICQRVEGCWSPVWNLTLSTKWLSAVTLLPSRSNCHHLFSTYCVPSTGPQAFHAVSLRWGSPCILYAQAGKEKLHAHVFIARKQQNWYWNQAYKFPDEIIFNLYYHFPTKW